MGSADRASRHTRAILDRLRFIARGQKSFDSTPAWDEIPCRATSRLLLVVALRLNGTRRGGVSLRLATPADAWEEDVYGHIEVRLPGFNSHAPSDPVEWLSPYRYRDNPPSAPPAHRSQRLWDRWLPLEINAQFSLAAFDQSANAIAVPLPRALANFSEYVLICAPIFGSLILLGLAPPPWSKRII